MRHNMEAANIKSFKRPLFTITLAMGSERVIVDHEDHNRAVERQYHRYAAEVVLLRHASGREDNDAPIRLRPDRESLRCLQACGC